MRGIERAHGVCRQTLSAWLKEKAEQLPSLDATLIPIDPEQTPVLELDELCPFVFKNNVERWNNTLRQHVARFVRKTLFVSKCIIMHAICLKLFLHRYNTELLPAID